jgi:hypothetical protein
MWQTCDGIVTDYKEGPARYYRRPYLLLSAQIVVAAGAVMTPREIEEYRALRATIGQRGTMRVWLFLLTMTAWAAATIATTALAALPVATLLPLLVLASGFEAVVQLHTGVERIGRYLQVFYAEPDSTREWERTAMAYGHAYPRPGTDPLFGMLFVLATVSNFVPVLLAEPVRMEVSVVGTVHLVFVARLMVARRAAQQQRALDLERFNAIKGG